MTPPFRHAPNPALKQPFVPSVGAGQRLGSHRVPKDFLADHHTSAASRSAYSASQAVGWLAERYKKMRHDYCLVAEHLGHEKRARMEVTQCLRRILVKVLAAPSQDDSLLGDLQALEDYCNVGSPASPHDRSRSVHEDMGMFTSDDSIVTMSHLQAIVDDRVMRLKAHDLSGVEPDWTPGLSRVGLQGAEQHDQGGISVAEVELPKAWPEGPADGVNGTPNSVGHAMGSPLTPTRGPRHLGAQRSPKSPNLPPPGANGKLEGFSIASGLNESVSQGCQRSQQAETHHGPPFQSSKEISDTKLMRLQRDNLELEAECRRFRELSLKLMRESGMSSGDPLGEMSPSNFQTPPKSSPTAMLSRSQQFAMASPKVPTDPAQAQGITASSRASPQEPSSASPTLQPTSPVPPPSSTLHPAHASPAASETSRSIRDKLALAEQSIDKLHRHWSVMCTEQHGLQATLGTIKEQLQEHHRDGQRQRADVALVFNRLAQLQAAGHGLRDDASGPRYADCQSTTANGTARGHRTEGLGNGGAALGVAAHSAQSDMTMRDDMRQLSGEVQGLQNTLKRTMQDFETSKQRLREVTHELETTKSQLMQTQQQVMKLEQHLGTREAQFARWLTEALKESPWPRTKSGDPVEAQAEVPAPAMELHGDHTSSSAGFGSASSSSHHVSSASGSNQELKHLPEADGGDLQPILCLEASQSTGPPDRRVRGAQEPSQHLPEANSGDVQPISRLESSQSTGPPDRRVTGAQELLNSTFDGPKGVACLGMLVCLLRDLCTKLRAVALPHGAATEDQSSAHQLERCLVMALWHAELADEVCLAYLLVLTALCTPEPRNVVFCRASW